MNPSGHDQICAKKFQELKAAGLSPKETYIMAKLLKYNLYDLSQTEKDIMYHFTKDFEDGFEMNFEVKDNRIRLIIEGEEFEIK